MSSGIRWKKFNQIFKLKNRRINPPVYKIDFLCKDLLRQVLVTSLDEIRQFFTF